MIPVFETGLVEDGRIRLRLRHLARLAASGAPRERVADVAAALDELVARPDQPFTARIDVRDGGIEVRTRPPRLTDPVDLPVHRSYDPALGIRRLKTSDRAWAEAIEAECGGEALLVSPAGLVGETTRAAVMCVRADGRLVVPPLEGILASVTRAWAVDETGAAEEELRLDDLLAARGAAILTAGAGVIPIASVDGAALARDPLFDALQERWRALP